MISRDLCQFCPPKTHFKRSTESEIARNMFPEPSYSKKCVLGSAVTPFYHTSIFDESFTGRLTKIPTSRWVIVGYEGYILLVCLIKKLIYFVNINHNPMNSDPKCTTSCRDPLLNCLLYTSPSPRDRQKSRMPSSA